MKPLYALKYIKRNKKKSFSVIVCIAAAVFLLYTFQILMTSLSISNELIALNPLKKYSLVFSSNRGSLSDYLVSAIREDKNVDKVIPINTRYTGFTTGASSSTVNVYEMSSEDLKYFMKVLGIKLKEGRLPQHSKDEILLDYRLAKNKKLKLGDMIGSEVNREENLEGKYKIVGIIDGNSINALTLSDETMNKEVQNYSGIMVFHKKGKENEAYSLLKIQCITTSVFTYNSTKEDIDKQTSNSYRTINIMAAMIIAALSISVGNICYVHFFSRRREFGILNALGYSHNFIIKRAFFEISLMNFIGFGIGLLFSIIVGAILRFIFLFSLGIPLSLVSKSGLIQCLCVPIFTTILALKPISFMIKRIDAVTMIEGVK